MLLAVFIALSGWLFVGPIVVGVRAHRRGRGVLGVASVALLEAGGTVLGSFGLLALAYNGYVDDHGSSAAHTLAAATPALSVSAVMIVGGWLASGR